MLFYRKSQFSLGMFRQLFGDHQNFKKNTIANYLNSFIINQLISQNITLKN